LFFCWLGLPFLTFATPVILLQAAVSFKNDGDCSVMLPGRLEMLFGNWNDVESPPLPAEMGELSESTKRSFWLVIGLKLQCTSAPMTAARLVFVNSGNEIDDVGLRPRLLIAWRCLAGGVA
jgi:hypothetical protein